MVAFTPNRRAVSRGEYNSKNIGQMSCIKENKAKNYISLCGGKASKMTIQAVPLPLPKVAGPHMGDPPK
jgi:hypothetical protein